MEADEDKITSNANNMQNKNSTHEEMKTNPVIHPKTEKNNIFSNTNR